MLHKSLDGQLNLTKYFETHSLFQVLNNQLELAPMDKKICEHGWLGYHYLHHMLSSNLIGFYLTRLFLVRKVLAFELISEVGERW